MIELLLLFANQGVAGNLIFQLYNSWRPSLKQLFMLDPARAWRTGDISQISHACGYQSQSRFSERFKKRFSMSPIELRNSRNAPGGDDNVVSIRLTD